jgi:hypothetical protein
MRDVILIGSKEMLLTALTSVKLLRSTAATTATATSTATASTSAFLLSMDTVTNLYFTTRKEMKVALDIQKRLREQNLTFYLFQSILK